MNKMALKGTPKLHTWIVALRLLTPRPKHLQQKPFPAGTRAACTSVSLTDRVAAPGQPRGGKSKESLWNSSTKQLASWQGGDRVSRRANGRTAFHKWILSTEMFMRHVPIWLEAKTTMGPKRGALDLSLQPLTPASCWIKGTGTSAEAWMAADPRAQLQTQCSVEPATQQGEVTPLHNTPQGSLTASAATAPKAPERWDMVACGTSHVGADGH